MLKIKTPLELECDRLCALLARQPGLTVTAIMFEHGFSVQALESCNRNDRIDTKAHNGHAAQVFLAPDRRRP